MSTSELDQVLTSAVDVLERLGLSYHVTGGLASSYYGEPRFTQDIDLVVRLELETLEGLVKELESEFLVDPDEVRTAVAGRDMFQALHRRLLIKVDFHVGESLEGELDRGHIVGLLSDRPVQLVSKEDAILSKLLWAKQGSEKSLRDVHGMLLDPIPYDEGFVVRTSRAIGCAEILEQVRRMT